MPRGHSPKKKLCECGHAKRIPPQREQATSAWPHTMRLPRMPLPILQTKGTMKLCQGHFRPTLAGCGLWPVSFLPPFSLTHTLRIDLLFGLRYF